MTDSNLATIVWNAYLRNLRERPLQTKLMTAASIYALSNAIAQLLGPQRRLDVRALLKHTGFAAISVPLMHYYYGWVDRLFAGRDGVLVLAAQLFIDQALFSPVFYVIYYVYQALLDGKLERVPEQIRTELLPTTIDSAKFWTLVQLVNFKFVPVELRILFGNVCNLLWSIYWLMQMDQKKQD